MHACLFQKSGNEFNSLCILMPVALKGDLAAIIKKNEEVLQFLLSFLRLF